MTTAAAAATRAAQSSGAASKIHRENVQSGPSQPSDAFAQLLQTQAEPEGIALENVATADSQLSAQDERGAANIGLQELAEPLAEQLQSQRQAAADIVAAQAQTGNEPIDAATASLADLAGTLLGQTRALDAQADTAQIDARAARGFASAQPQAATTAQSLGAGVATVAAGVELSDTAAARADIAQAVADAADAERSAHSQAADRLFAAAALTRQGVNAALQAGRSVAGQGLEGDGAGTFTLGLGWDVMPADAQNQPPSADMQRVATQVAAFAQQWLQAGGARSYARVGKSASGAEVEGLSAADAASVAANAFSGDAASGTRVLEQSVAEAAQAEATQSEFAAEAEAALHDMRYWLNGKNQRAELQIQHRDADGQLHNVRVQVALAGQEARVQFASADAATRQALEANQGELRQMLEGAGLQLQTVQVAAEQSSAAVQLGAALGADAGGANARGSGQGSGEGATVGVARRGRVAAPVAAQPAGGGTVAPRRSSASGVDLFA